MTSGRSGCSSAPGYLNVFNTAFVYATTLVLLVRLSPQLTLWALLPYPALLAGARVFTRKMYRASRAIAEQLGTLSAAIQEDLAGIAVIKSYTLEESREASFRTLNDEYLRRSLAHGARHGGPDAALRRAGRPRHPGGAVGRRA